MKSHLPVKDYIIHNGAKYILLDKCEEHLKSETNKRIGQLYEEIGKDIVAQISAVFLSVLNREFGFGTDRLKKVFSGTKSMFIMMNNKALSKDFTPDDCIKFVKEKFGIDVFKE